MTQVAKAGGMKLRPYEADWLQRIRGTRARRTLIVGPTGSGKTVVASTLMLEARARRKRSLFVVHRRELVKQAVQRLRDSGVGKCPQIGNAPARAKGSGRR